MSLNNEMRTAQFLFGLNTNIKAKNMPTPLYDECLVIGRVLDADENNQPAYIVVRPSGLSWMTAEYAHQNFIVKGA